MSYTEVFPSRGARIGKKRHAPGAAIVSETPSDSQWLERAVPQLRADEPRANVGDSDEVIRLEAALRHAPPVIRYLYLSDAPPATLARAEWAHIMRILQDCNGNVSMAARRLGSYRSSLRHRLPKYGGTPS